MKRELLILCLISLVILSCKKNPAEPKVIISPQSPEIFSLNTTGDFSANLPVDWTFSHTNAGNVDASGTFVAGDSSGHFTLIATSQEDETNSDTVHIRISNRADILNEILGGGYVIYLRHAIARVGADSFDIKPNWHLTCNSDTARQLSPEGITQAEQLGEAFKNLGIPLTDTIYSSEFCRCIRTPEIMDLDKTIVQEKAITYYVYGENERHQKTKAFIDGLNPGEKNILLSSHSFGPGSDYPQVEQGYAAIFRAQSGPTFITIITDHEFIELR